MVWLTVPPGRFANRHAAQPLAGPLDITVHGVGNPAPRTGPYASMARSASSPFVATVKYDPASSSGPPCLEHPPDACLRNAMAVTGPHDARPTINAFMCAPPI